MEVDMDNNGISEIIKDQGLYIIVLSDQYEIRKHVNIDKTLSFVCDFEQYLRNMWKHGDEETIEIEKLWDMWHDKKYEHGVNDE